MSDLDKLAAEAAKAQAALAEAVNQRITAVRDALTAPAVTEAFAAAAEAASGLPANHPLIGQVGNLRLVHELVTGDAARALRTGG